MIFLLVVSGSVSAGSLNVWTDAQNHIWVENEFYKWDETLLGVENPFFLIKLFLKVYFKGFN